MNARFKLAVIFVLIGMVSTVVGSIFKMMGITFANTLMMLGLAAHFSGAGILVFSLLDQRKLS